jgi:hypothetical protein
VRCFSDEVSAEGGYLRSVTHQTTRIRQKPCSCLYRAIHLDLSDEEKAALIKELHDAVENDPYPFSPRIRTLRAILAKLRPEPVREPLPLPKVYAPPRFIRGRRRG